LEWEGIQQEEEVVFSFFVVFFGEAEKGRNDD
jgi:hypothetical protein